nr:MAG TPA: hypothetical protein [Caudoviricetes sp.]
MLYRLLIIKFDQARAGSDSCCSSFFFFSGS